MEALKSRIDLLTPYLNLPQHNKVQLEYIWIDGTGNLRSKTMVRYLEISRQLDAHPSSDGRRASYRCQGPQKLEFWYVGPSQRRVSPSKLFVLTPSSDGSSTGQAPGDNSDVEYVSFRASCRGRC